MNTQTLTKWKIQFLKSHPGQKEIIKKDARFRVVACGRRFGKTEVGKRLITLYALKGKRCWWLAPTYAMAEQVWRDLKMLCREVPFMEISESERRLDFHNRGGVIAIRSTHYPDNLRGAGLDFAVLDEAAYMEPNVWPEIVRPMLLERRGRALFLSTPQGLNWFWEIYQLGLDPTHEEWKSFHFPSKANPFLPPKDIDEMRRTMTERIFREEILAEFVDDSGQVFRGIREAATAPMNAQPISDHRYFGGLDWGRESNSTAIVIIDADTRQVVALDRFNQIGWSLQRGRLQAMIERWQPAAVWAEENSIGSVNIEALQNEGLPIYSFKTTAQSKAPLIEALALAIERGELALLPDETLLHELASYRMERLPGGGYRYSAPSGGHDDTVVATALALHGVNRGTVLFDFI